MFNWFKKKPEIGEYQRPVVSIRLEAIGGQGANSAGKIIAEAAVLGKGYTGNHFSSFGSEKRGTPVRSFVRFSPQKKPIRTASYVRDPDILVIFHEQLLESHPDILEGTHEHSIILLNTSKSWEEIKLPVDQIKFRRLVTLDATLGAMKNQCGLNAVMMGAVSGYLPEVGGPELEKSLENFFKKAGTQVQKNNRDGFLWGLKMSKEHSFEKEILVEKNINQQNIILGWANAPVGGIIVNPGNMIQKNHSGSRKGLAPRFLKDICFNCGYCDMVCPDYCFVWKKNSQGQNILQGLDYQYCKACQKCIEVCPVNALVLSEESEIPASEKNESLLKLLSQKDGKN